MSDLELGCWYDFGEATCQLPDDHDGPHEPTPDNEVWVTLTDEQRPLRPNVTPVVQPVMRLRGVVLAVALSIPWWVGAYQIVRWILQ
jgi:hypothetical protein